MALKHNESFFVDGAGTAKIIGENGKVALMHLQEMSLEVSTDTEKVEGGDSLFAIHTFVTSKEVKATFTNASASLDAMAVTQGVDTNTNASLFITEKVTVGTAGELTLSKTTVEAGSVSAFKDDVSIDVTESGGVYSVASTYAGEEVEVFYHYTEATVAGMDVLTTSVPGYVEINHVSKPVKQKDGRYVQIYTTIYKARSDGSLKLDMKNKSAYAPELTFEAVDPEREDKRFLSIAVKDVTAEVTA